MFVHPEKAGVSMAKPERRQAKSVKERVEERNAALDVFNKRMAALQKSNDPMRIAVWGIELVEEALDLIITDSFSAPHEAVRRGMHLDTRIGFCAAHEVLETDVIDAIKTLDKIRHDFVHNFKDNWTEPEARDLWSRIPQRLTNHFRTTYEEHKDPVHAFRRTVGMLMFEMTMSMLDILERNLTLSVMKRWG
jgi:hypothetical protein